MKVLAYLTDGTKEEIFIKKSTCLEQLQHLVEGRIELIVLEKGGKLVDLIINEEGYEILPVNPFSEEIFKGTQYADGFIYGNAAVFIEGRLP